MTHIRPTAPAYVVMRARWEHMAHMREQGTSTRLIGSRHGISEERVRQVLARRDVELAREARALSAVLAWLKEAMRDAAHEGE